MEKINLNDLALKVTAREGKKVSINNAQVKEAMRLNEEKTKLKIMMSHDIGVEFDERGNVKGYKQTAQKPSLTTADVEKAYISGWKEAIGKMVDYGYMREEVKGTIKALAKKEGTA